MLRFNLERLNHLEFLDATEPSTEQGPRDLLVTDMKHPVFGNFWRPGHIIGYEHTFIATRRRVPRVPGARRAVPSEFRGRARHAAGARGPADPPRTRQWTDVSARLTRREPAHDTSRTTVARAASGAQAARRRGAGISASQRWTIVGLLSASIMINLLDRQVLVGARAGAARRPSPLEDQPQYAYIAVAFNLGMMVGQIPAGSFMDRVGTASAWRRFLGLVGDLRAHALAGPARRRVDPAAHLALPGLPVLAPGSPGSSCCAS